MTTREQWLEARRCCIGASDVAAILGESPYKTALDVYADKLCAVNESDADHLAFGRDVEGAIAKMYAKKTGRDVWDLGATSISYHHKYPFIGATLDRVTKGCPANPSPEGCEFNGPLELKHVGTFDRPEQWREDPPLHYQLQLQIQMACHGDEWGSLAALFPGYNLVWKDMRRDDELLEAIYPRLFEFWDRVQRRDPPPPQTGAALDAIKRIWPAESGETVTLDEDTNGLVIALEQCKIDLKSGEAIKSEIESKIRFAMKDATFGLLNDGRIVTLKTTKRAGYTATIEPTEFRTLRITKRK
jgi:putative phage-type endonuclease